MYSTRKESLQISVRPIEYDFYKCLDCLIAFYYNSSNLKFGEADVQEIQEK